MRQMDYCPGQAVFSALDHFDADDERAHLGPARASAQDEIPDLFCPHG
jgi:hypothetical protein